MTNELPDEMARGAPQQVSDQELLDVAKSVVGPAFTVTELVEQTPIGSEWIRQRLKSLQDDQIVESKKVGHQRVYWFEADGES